MSKFCLAPLISILALSGCVSIPALEQHSITNITAPTLGDTNSGFKDISAIDNMNAQNNEWWKKFNDGQLDKLMNQVISNNIDLNIAKLNIDKVALLINNSQTYKSPQVNTTATVERQKLASNAFYPPPLAGSLINFSQVGVNATYNVDLFNKLSNEINSQSLQKESLILKKRALVFSLSVQTFKLYGYWQYLLTQKQLFQEQKNTYSNLLSLTEKKISLGLGQQEEILHMQNMSKNIDISLAELTFNQEQVKNALLQLAGTFNLSDIVLDNNNLENNILQTKLLPINSINSSVIVNRPDIQSYLVTIESQQSHLKSLQADFYPSITLSGDLGFQKIGMSSLLKASNIFATIAPTIKLPIFDSGRIKNNYKIAGVDLNIFIEQYNQSVLNSYYDLNNQIYSVKNNFNILSIEDSALTNEKNTYSLNQQRFKLGKISQLNLNLTKLSYLNQQNKKLSAQFNYFNSHVALINSIGGLPQ